MTWRTFIKSAWILPLLLATMCFLAGCQSIQTTHTAETERDIVAAVCWAWKPVTYSSRDTPETQLQARANNSAHDAYCRDVR